MQKIQKTRKIKRKKNLWSNHPKVLFCPISFQSPCAEIFIIALYLRDYSL